MDRRTERRAARRARRRARALAEEALARCSPPGRSLSEEDVHRLRVIAKMLRGYWQAQRGVLGARQVRPALDALRDGARRLAPAREAQVLRRTLAEQVCPHAAGAAESDACAALGDALARVRPVPTADAVVADAALHAVQLDQLRRLGTLPRRPPAGAVRDGVMRSWRRARRCGRRARRCGRRALAAGEAAQWHRCRRWAKYELYQLQLLAPARAPRGRLRRLDAFADRLGRFHDLCDLGSVVDEVAGELDAAGALVPARALLDRAAAAALDGIPARFERLYGMPPRRRLGRWLGR